MKLPQLASWNDRLLAAARFIAHRLARLIDFLRFRFKRLMGWVKPPQILPYRGFGDSQSLYLKGRVQEKTDIRPAKEGDSVWRNAVSVYQRFTTDEIPNIAVHARVRTEPSEQQVGGQVCETVTDEEGFFECRFHLSTPLVSDQLWQPIDLQLLDNQTDQAAGARQVGYVLTPPADSDFGVISDIDDTVIHSHATDFLRLLRITLTRNARTRSPLAGVPTFYRALHRGAEGGRQNPFFYVSSSAWNLYDVLIDILEFRRIPLGPVLLRDLSWDRKRFVRSNHEHKFVKIRQIFQTYPALSFLLIGDAGQHDPRIYRRVVDEFPGRVKAVYIREVRWMTRYDEALAMAREVQQQGVEFMLVKDTWAAAKHAAEQGWIDPQRLDEIRRECEVDQPALPSATG